MQGGYFYGDRVFTIRKAADIEKAEIFYTYESASVKECEEISHKYYTEGKPEKVNNFLLRPIMERHEKELNEHLQAIYGKEKPPAGIMKEFYKRSKADYIRTHQKKRAGKLQNCCTRAKPGADI